MSNSSISLGFKMADGPDGLKTLILDADSLRKIMRANVEEAQKLQNNFINVAAITTGIKGLTDACSDFWLLPLNWAQLPPHLKN